MAVNQQWFDLYDPRSGAVPSWVQDFQTGQADMRNYTPILQALGMSTDWGPIVGGVDALQGKNIDKWNELNGLLASKGQSLGFMDGGYGGQGNAKALQVFDKDGSPVGNADTFTGSSMLEMLSPVLMAAGMYGLQSAGLMAPSTFGGVGQAAGAGLGDVAALGMDQVAALGGAPEAAGSGIGTLGGGTELAYTAAPALETLGAVSPELAASLGVESILPTTLPGLATGATNAALIESALQTPGYGASSAGLGGGAGLSGLPALWNGVKDFIAPVSSLVKDLGGASTLLPLLGAAAGAASGGGTTTATTQQKMDPRMDAYIYGTGKGDPNSLLGAAWNQFQQNPSGINPTMQQGLDMQKSALMDPAYSQAYQQMRSVGNGLLGQGIAANPFSTGARQLPPQMQAGGVGGLLGGSVQDLIKAGRGLI